MQNKTVSSFFVRHFLFLSDKLYFSHFYSVGAFIRFDLFISLSPVPIWHRRHANTSFVLPSQYFTCTGRMANSSLALDLKFLILFWIEKAEHFSNQYPSEQTLPLFRMHAYIFYVLPIFSTGKSYRLLYPSDPSIFFKYLWVRLKHSKFVIAWLTSHFQY